MCIGWGKYSCNFHNWQELQEIGIIYSNQHESTWLGSV